MRNPLRSFPSALAVAAAASLALAATALAAPMAFTADLTGGDSGDPAGSGTASITIDTDTGEVCWDLRVEGISGVTASHIHVGAEGAEGDVVVPLDVDGFSGTSEGCVDAADADLQAIVDDPAGYYVNVHTEEFPAGAIRGQLVAGETPDTAVAEPGGAPVAVIGLLLLVLALASGTRLALRRS